MKRRRWKVTIVGAGKVGSVLGRILADAKVPITAVISRTLFRQKCARFVRCKRSSTSLTAIPPETSLILITTPHNAVVMSRWRSPTGAASVQIGLSVCHASGMLTAEALAPSRRARSNGIFLPSPSDVSSRL